MSQALRPITFAYDKSRKKVGCALLQVAYGANIDNFTLQRFGTANWLLAPTPELELFSVSEADLERVITLTGGS